VTTRGGVRDADLVLPRNPEGNRTSATEDIVTAHAGSILRIQLNRPAKRNATTSVMYVALTDILNNAKDENSASCSGMAPTIHSARKPDNGGRTGVVRVPPLAFRDLDSFGTGFCRGLLRPDVRRLSVRLGLKGADIGIAGRGSE
jgi:hypothetical protein